MQLPLRCMARGSGFRRGEASCPALVAMDLSRSQVSSKEGMASSDWEQACDCNVTEYRHVTVKDLATIAGSNFSAFWR